MREACRFGVEVEISGLEESTGVYAFVKVMVALKTSPAKNALAPGLTVTTKPDLGALWRRIGEKSAI